MKKDKEWLKEEIRWLCHSKILQSITINVDVLDNLIDQLEEPEQGKVEKLYTACFAPIGTRQGVYLYRESGSVKVGDNMKVYDKSKQEYHLTEQEIRNRDERFWAFAEEITK